MTIVVRTAVFSILIKQKRNESEDACTGVANWLCIFPGGNWRHVYSEYLLSRSDEIVFVKPFDPVTLDVFIGSEYLCEWVAVVMLSLFLEDLEVGTKYTVKLSYPGVSPVQFDVFLEREDDVFESSVHKRRIQDTRIFTFETNKRGDIFRVEHHPMGESSIVIFIEDSDN